MKSIRTIHLRMIFIYDYKHYLINQNRRQQASFFASVSFTFLISRLFCWGFESTSSDCWGRTTWFFISNSLKLLEIYRVGSLIFYLFTVVCASVSLKISTFSLLGDCVWIFIKESSFFSISFLGVLSSDCYSFETSNSFSKLICISYWASLG